ncbi:hypothetical protein GLAREA_02878 [Glarea lozoyensis ATCC 20868]|uniref:Ubiquinol-cytochrome-c reductase complex assembly factor 2 n=1 Tax=Glarea lozoyensis (strain ATCC 20868 / MF5171) TaxID=1116229 RepID=S3CP74_GLAL2|nr:uncharacterized protein GLAREA_02878 [Glarea lozoyensis ATCC 20868]EPE26964.1 hypothetical protein GLAREA_02878 [Glarea lozoyensis ATCC 20868]
MSQSVVYKHYLRALSKWPKDALRPECRFEDVMQKRIERKFNPSKNVPDGKPAGAVTINEKAEMDQVNAIYSLINNRYTKQYPLGSSFMKPTSNPTHYKDLVRELEEAPNRSWFSSMLNKWKGSLRLS